MTKGAERSLVDVVFPPGLPWEIEASERPDFQCRQGGRVVHGVEVTEFYPSDAEARLKNYPGYASRILSGGKHHKGDETRIPEVTVAFKNVSLRAVLHDRPSMQEVVVRLHGRLLEKNSKCTAYFASSPTVDLIVGDPCEVLPLKELRGILSFLCVDILREQIATSGFREIFVATLRPRSVFFPLKANLLSMAIATFERRLKRSLRDGLIDGTGPAPLLALILHLSEAGIRDALVWLSPPPRVTEVRVALGSLEVRYTDAGRLPFEIMGPLDRYADVSGWRSVASRVAEFDERDEDLARTALGPAIESWDAIPLLFEGGTGNLLSQPQTAVRQNSALVR